MDKTEIARTISLLHAWWHIKVVKGSRFHVAKKWETTNLSLYDVQLSWYTALKAMLWIKKIILTVGLGIRYRRNQNKCKLWISKSFSSATFMVVKNIGSNIFETYANRTLISLLEVLVPPYFTRSLWNFYLSLSFRPRVTSTTCQNNFRSRSQGPPPSLASKPISSSTPSSHVSLPSRHNTSSC